MFDQSAAPAPDRRNGSDSRQAQGLRTAAGQESDDGVSGDLLRVHVVVSGLVQGVGYRYFALTAARRLGISGWVRNRSDGSVELEAQASRRALREFLGQLESGNEFSRVRDVQVTPLRVDPAERDFRVTR